MRLSQTVVHGPRDDLNARFVSLDPVLRPGVFSIDVRRRRAESSRVSAIRLKGL